MSRNLLHLFVAHNRKATRGCEKTANISLTCGNAGNNRDACVNAMGNKRCGGAAAEERGFTQKDSVRCGAAGQRKGRAANYPLRLGTRGRCRQQTPHWGGLVSPPGGFCVSRFLIWSAPKPTINTASSAGRTSSLRSCSFAPAIKPNRAMTSAIASRR
jgi:hypothetical protein